MQLGSLFAGRWTAGVRAIVCEVSDLSTIMASSWRLCRVTLVRLVISRMYWGFLWSGVVRRLHVFKPVLVFPH